MTEIHVAHVGNRFFVEAEGHADYEESGKDIVCAAISTLLQSFGFFLTDKAEEYKCQIVDLTLSSGYSRIVAEGSDLDILPAFEMMVAGLESIATTYPKNVKI